MTLFAAVQSNKVASLSAPATSSGVSPPPLLQRKTVHVISLYIVLLICILDRVPYSFSYAYLQVVGMLFVIVSGLELKGKVLNRLGSPTALSV